MIGKTVYRAHPALEEAPDVTDCLTSVHYLFKRVLEVDLQLTWIGDMPRQLACNKDWKILSLDRKEAQFGDIFFTKHKNRPKLLSHVAMIFGPDTIFHCSRDLKTAKIEKDLDFFAAHEQALSLDEALRYIDPRNKALRKEHVGIFIHESS